RSYGDWSSDVCSSDLAGRRLGSRERPRARRRCRAGIDLDHRAPRVSAEIACAGDVQHRAVGAHCAGVLALLAVAAAQVDDVLEALAAHDAGVDPRATD